MSSAAATSRYSSAGSSTRTAPELLKLPIPGYRVNSANVKRSRKSDAVGDIINDSSEGEVEDPTLFIAPGSEKALVGVTRYITIIITF